MRSRSYLEKHFLLKKEAEIDIKNRAYNKTVSALWFSLEALLRALLIGGGKTPPEKPGKLISYSMQTLFLNIDNPEHLARIVNSLYNMRTQVDHRDKIADIAYAKKALKRYREALEIISKLYPLQDK